MPAATHSDAPPRITIRQGISVLAGAILLAIIVVTLSYKAERARLIDLTLRNEVIPPPADQRFPYYAPGVVTPATVGSHEAALADDQEIIGIEVGGKARAYSLRAMSALSRHIINDVVGDSAVSITYCDGSECIKAFGGGDRRTPLDISNVGLLDGHMLLQVANVSYIQETGEIVEAPAGTSPPPFPYATIPSTRTTWGKWKARHVETDVYTGPDPVAVRQLDSSDH